MVACLMENLSWKAFRSHTVRRCSLVVACLLLLVSAYGVWWAFSTPIEVKEQVTLFSYQHNGKFDHQIYAEPGILNKSNSAEEAKSVYFNNIIESVDVVFSYKFLLEGAVAPANSLVKVSAILENPGMWQYEVILLPQSVRGGDFTIDFPLDTAQFKELTDKIGEEIGIRNVYPDVTLKAIVHTETNTKFGVLQSDFAQTANVKLAQTLMKWDKELARSERGLYHGLRYEHQGIFDYTIKLKPSILYGGAVTVKSNTPLPEPPVAMPRSQSYSIADIDSMDVLFSYNFDCDELVGKSVEEVEITAILGNPEHWSEPFVLVPKRNETGDFTITVPLDLRQFYEIIEAKQSELRVFAQSHDLIIQAEVHTSASGSLGSVDEVFKHSLDLTLDPNSIGLIQDATEPKTEFGSVASSVNVPRTEVETARRFSPVILGVAVMACLYVLWNYIQVRPTQLNASEAEFLRARKKYKNVIVDIKEIPEAKDRETVIALDSLNGLIKTADDLLKPVFHNAEGQRHTYYVIDGSTRYEYVS